MVRMEDAGRLKKAMFHYFLDVARRCGEKILDGKPVGAARTALLYRLGDLLVYAPLRNRMGFSSIRVAYTAGEAIGPELFRFYRSLGINLKQLYGKTEASVYITLQPDGEVYPDTVGKPGPGRRDQDRRQRRGAVQEPRRVPEVLQERRGDGGSQDAGRLGAHGRCRLHRPARAPQDHRPRQGRRPPQQRRAVRAEVPREPHQVLSRDPRGGGLRPGARLRDDVHQHRPDLGRQLGRAQQRRPYASYQELAAHPQVYEMVRQARRRAEPGARRGAADGGLADPALPDPAQGARRRRRRADAHAEGAPLLHRRALRAADRGALRRLHASAASPPR